MQSNELKVSPDELDLSILDMSPLAWVLAELGKSLDSSSKALKHFVRDAQVVQGSELAALDASQLRIARQQLHQAVGALEMVGMRAPALVLQAMEAAVQKFVQTPGQCTPEAANKVELAGFALIAYLEDVLAGKPASAVSLFPQYRDVQGLVGADRIHPADLWAFEWRWIEPALACGAPPLAYGDASRALLDRWTLKLVRNSHPEAAQQLCSMCLGFAQAETDSQAREGVLETGRRLF